MAAVVVKNDVFEITLIPADGLSQIVKCCRWFFFLMVAFWKSISYPFSNNSGVPRIGEQFSATT